MAFRKGQKKTLKQRLPIFDDCERLLRKNISNCDLIGFIFRYVRLSPLLHLSSSSSSLPPSSHPTAPPAPLSVGLPPLLPDCPPALRLFISPFLHLIRLRHPFCFVFFFFFFKLKFGSGRLISSTYCSSFYL